MQMCVYCPEGDVVKKKKSRQDPELEIALWAKGRCWARAVTGREDGKKGGGAGEKVPGRSRKGQSGHPMKADKKVTAEPRLCHNPRKDLQGLVGRVVNY